MRDDSGVTGMATSAEEEDSALDLTLDRSARAKAPVTLQPKNEQSFPFANGHFCSPSTSSHGDQSTFGYESNQQEEDDDEEVESKCPNCGFVLHRRPDCLNADDGAPAGDNNWDEEDAEKRALQAKIADLSSALIARDLEIATLRERCSLLMASVEQQDEIIAKIYSVAYPEPVVTGPSTYPAAVKPISTRIVPIDTTKLTNQKTEPPLKQHVPTNTSKRIVPVNSMVGPARQMLETHLDSMGFQCNQITEVLESLSEGLTSGDNNVNPSVTGRTGTEVDILNAALDRLLYPPVLQRRQTTVFSKSNDEELSDNPSRRRRHSYCGDTHDSDSVAMLKSNGWIGQPSGDFATAAGFLRRPSRKAAGRLSVSDFGLLSEEESSFRNKGRSRKKSGANQSDNGNQEVYENEEEKEDDQDDSASSYGSSGGSTISTLFAEIDEEESRRQSRANTTTSITNDSEEDKDEDLTYAEFLERISLPGSRDILDAIRRFVGSILGPRGDGSEPRAYDHVDYVFYGTHELRRRCQQFFESMNDTLSEHVVWRHASESILCKARDGIEKFVMDKIAHIAFSQLAECKKWQEDDAKLLRRMKILSFVTPDMLDIKRCMRNEVVWCMAEDELRRINLCRSPGEKINCIVRCCSIIFSVLNLSRGGDLMESANRPGADDFLPVFIYVVLHSQIPSLVSNCEFIAAYRDPSDLMSKAGYCFVNLRSAIEFINVLDASMLSVSEDEFERLYHEAEQALN